MAFEDKKRQLIMHAAALVTAMYAFLFSRLRMVENARPRITYGPMTAMDVERQNNLNKIYNCDDVECVNML